MYNLGFTVYLCLLLIRFKVCNVITGITVFSVPHHSPLNSKTIKTFIFYKPVLFVTRCRNENKQQRKKEKKHTQFSNKIWPRVKLNGYIAFASKPNHTNTKLTIHSNFSWRAHNNLPR